MEPEHNRITRRDFLTSIGAIPLVLSVPVTVHCSRGGLEPLSENLYRFRDTCHVYVIRRGEEALLIDFGSGRVLDHLASIGVKSVAWVLHTHHHRDQCHGDARLQPAGIPVAVPHAMRSYFEDPVSLWERVSIYHSYQFKPDFFEPVDRIPVTRTIKAGDRFQWAGLSFEAVANVGHTRVPGLTYIAEIDGKRAAFTGDLIHSPGKVWTYHDMRWRYNQQKGVRRTIETMEGVRDRHADLLLPSHGEVMRHPAAALEQTMHHLTCVMELQQKHIGPGKNQFSNGRILPHIYHDRTSFFIIADNGHCLLYDFGWDGKYADRLLDDLMLNQGLKTIDMVIPSHYHDDHIGGIPYLKQRFPEMQVWAHRCMSDVLEHPYRYNIPCLGTVGYPDEFGIRMDRILDDDETFEWEGYRFTAFHFPGQTEYHMGLFTEIDGYRMLFMGDSTYRPAENTPFRGVLTNFRNYCRLGEGVGYHKCAQVLKKYQPHMAMSAHYGGLPIGPEQIREYEQWALDQTRVFQDVIAREDPNFGTDPNWLSFYPYRIFVEAGETFSTAVRIRNHSGRKSEAIIEPRLPAGWSAEPGRIRLSIPAKKTGEAAFHIGVGSHGALARRTVLTANVIYDQVDYGPYPHMIADKRSEKATWARQVFNQFKRPLESVRNHPERIAFGWPAAWWQPETR
jgi:glyoxylase-like metal-dependent hydrolase (beta-lactamase superfamily II)